MSAIECFNCGGVGESSLATVYCARCYAALRSENARLARQCAELVSEWGREAKLNPDNEHQIGIVETLKDCAGDLAALPDVAAVLKGEA